MPVGSTYVLIMAVDKLLVMQDGGYHVSVAHPELAAGLDLPSYRSTIYESCSIQSCQPNSAAEARLGNCHDGLCFTVT